MKKVKRILALLLVCIMAVVITACGGSGSGDNSASPGNSSSSASSPESSGSSAPGSSSTASTDNTSEPSGSSTGSGRDTLNVVVSSDSGTLAHQDMSGDMFSAIELVNEPLWRQAKMAGDAGIELILAESVEEITRTEWIVHLRKGVTFSNGNPFTASDVMFSVQLMQESTLKGATHGNTMVKETSEIIDDYTIHWFWNNVSIGQYGVVTDILIVDEESYDHVASGTRPIGTGPCVVKEYVTNSHLFLERRDDYWGELPEFKYYNFRVMAEPSQVVNALETGMVDFAAKIENQDYDHINSLPGIKMYSYYDTNYAGMGFNVSPPSIMHNKEARYAVCHAIDRQAIVNVVYSGRAVVLGRANGNEVEYNEARFDNVGEIYSIGYDVELAKQYAESSGLVGQTVRVMNNGSPQFVLISEMVQDFLAQIGVNVTIVSFDAATFTTFSREDVTASEWDIRVFAGINPGYLAPSPMINGVNLYAVYNTPGHWEGVEEYTEYSRTFFQEMDPAVRSEITMLVIERYNEQALGYGICDIQTNTALAEDLDPSTIVIRHQGGFYFAMLKTLP